MKKFNLMMLFLWVVFVPVSIAQAYTLRPQWVPQAQFAGFYTAVEKGFYKNAGLEIQIKDGEPGIMALQEVASRETDFATGWLLSAIQLREKGGDIVLIGQIFQKPAMLLVTKKSSGIDSIEKFTGHTIGVWPGDFQIPPRALLRKYQIKGVSVVNQAFSMEPFLKGEIDIASAMRYNEYHQILESGLKVDDLVVFDYADLGMNLPEDGVYVHKDFLKHNRDVCERFIEATFEGWKYAFAHKDETAKLMTTLANKTSFKTTEKKQRIMLDEVEKLILLDDPILKKEDFTRAKDILLGERLISSDGVSYEAFTGQESVSQ